MSHLALTEMIDGKKVEWMELGSAETDMSGLSQLPEFGALLSMITYAAVYPVSAARTGSVATNARSTDTPRGSPPDHGWQGSGGRS
jgi:hypothetical protein